jgi:ATP-dependent DNA helicase RecQ
MTDIETSDMTMNSTDALDESAVAKNNIARETLANVFGYSDFRGDQQVIVDTLIAGNDAFVIMPTGGGKSLCYQIPALVRKQQGFGFGLVVSPLIALMLDQVEGLKQSGVKAEALHSGQTFEQQQAIRYAIESGELDMLYVSPERLGSYQFMNWLRMQKLALIAIDEAHCVSQWGHDFRADYLKLGDVCRQFVNVPRIALTATADELTKNDIIERLYFGDARQFLGGFDRPNIQYRIETKYNEKDQILKFIQREAMGESGIIYCGSRKKTEQIAEWLKEQGVNAMPYHAGLDSEVRARNQLKFLRDEAVVIVATIAFGMGIDKPDVRFVAHLNLPKSIEAYIQETGRAGRDGLASTAIMFYNNQDLVRTLQMIENTEAAFEQLQLNRYKFERMMGICEITSCRRQGLLAYFGQPLPKPCGNCDTCLQPPQTYNASTVVQKALSAIYRVGQGEAPTGYLIQLLVGKLNDRMVESGHDKLSVFGIGRELNDKQWKSVFRQIIAAHWVNVEPTTQRLSLHASCRDILKGKQSVQLRMDQKIERGSKKRAPIEFDNQQDQELWQELRTLRRELAKDMDVPPYQIFSDATLAEIVRNKPTNHREFLNINGVGQKKLENFADDFINEILLFC